MALLFLISVIVGICSKAFSKLCSNILSQNSVAKYSLVLVINSLVACLFFGAFGGFRIYVNSVNKEVARFEKIDFSFEEKFYCE